MPHFEFVQLQQLHEYGCCYVYALFSCSEANVSEANVCSIVLVRQAGQFLFWSHPKSLLLKSGVTWTPHKLMYRLETMHNDKAVTGRNTWLCRFA